MLYSLYVVLSEKSLTCISAQIIFFAQRGAQSTLEDDAPLGGKGMLKS